MKNIVTEKTLFDREDKYCNVSENTINKMKKDYKIAVIGGGSWATAIVKILSNNVKHVYWWVRETEIKEGVEKFNHNPLYLSDVEFKHNTVVISNDIVRYV